MPMRVTNSMMFKTGAMALQSQQQDLLKVQEQAQTGNRTNRPSDDPSGMYRHLIFSADLSGVQSLKKTTQFAAERFNLADTQMSHIHDALLGAQDLVLQFGESMIGGNPTVMKAAAQQPLSWYKDIMNNSNTELDEVPVFGGGKLQVPFDESSLMATSVQVLAKGTKSLSKATAVEASLTPGVVPQDVPLSVKIRYLSATNQYQADVNGVMQETVSLDENGQMSLGNWGKFTVQGGSNEGDTYYFEVVPQYRGGGEDRPVRLQQGGALPGNVTGHELLEGGGDYGRNVNILGSMAALRGALLRADPNEVALQLSRVQEGRAQVADLQGVTGIRNTQVEAVNTTLQADETALTTVRADNVEVDAFQVMSNLEQISQAMQIMTATQRQVMNTSLIDFIR
ncbi:MAG: hypothetical protein HQL93_04910 [Magnetococcales bacterium]|nr:hypothetical protein [Magnetococcales bacterium]